jgi:signal transduction histidine kinase
MSTQPNETAHGLLAEQQALFMLPKSIWLPIVAMSAVAVGAFLFNEWSVRSIREGAQQLTALLAMHSDVIELRTRLSDAEAGQREFLLGRDRRSLENQEESLALLPDIVARLRARAGADPTLLALVRQLDVLREQAVVELRAGALLAEQGHRDVAVLTERGVERHAVMESFRDVAQSLLSELGMRVARLRAHTAYLVQLSRVAFAALGMLTLALLAVAVRLLVKDFWRQEKARQEQTSERQRLEQIVGERTTELSELTTYLQSVTEREKAELARELHDELGGLLTAAKMDLAWLQGRASAREPEASVKLGNLASGIDEAMDVKRRVVESLRPALLDHFGLAMALKSYFEETCQKAGLKCAVRVPDDLEEIAPEVAIALFRVAQEALTNIIRHAHAGNVELRFEADAANFHISIVDDGVGIEVSRLSGRLSHGLVGMRHRIDRLGGRFSIGVNRPRGTWVDVTVPQARRR